MFELLQMWALVEVLGLMCLPLTVTVFRNLPDRGWAFSKSVGIGVLAFCVWLPLMVFRVFPFSQLFILGILLIVLALNIIGFVRVRHTLLQLLRAHKAYILVSELVFLGLVFLLGWIRSYGPDIRSYEMFMDEGFLAAIMRSPHFPPNDMWLSGYPINYYYYAHFTIAMLAKLLGQSPSIAFNTGICIFFGLTAVNMFGVTCNIVAWARSRRKRGAGAQLNAPGGNNGQSAQRSGRAFPALTGAIPYGLLSLVMGLVLGNLAATQDWWKQHGDFAHLPEFYWFNVSRVVDKTINEFPAFSFLLSCFHAHVLALAFTILAIGLAFNLFLERGDGDAEGGKGLRVFGRGWRLLLNLGFTALALGGLFTMNGWDFPTYLGLALVCIALQQWLAYQGRFCLELALDVFTACAALTALSFSLYAPFYLNFISPSQGIGIVSATDRSSIRQELLIYGTFAFIFYSLLLVNLVRERLAAGRVAMVMQPEVAHSTAADNGSSGNMGVVTGQLAGKEVGSLSLVGGTRPSGAIPAVRAGDEQTAADSPFISTGFAEQGNEDVSGRPAQVVEQPGREHDTRPRRPAWLDIRVIGMVLIIGIALLTLAVMKNGLTFVMAGSIAAIGALLALYHLHDRPRAFTLLLGTLAFTLVALCEVVYLRDVFADNFPRMNTVFKFYFQAWALLSITSGAGLYFIQEAFRPAAAARGLHVWVRRGGQAAWNVVFLLLLLAGAVYPLAGSYQRTNHFMERTNSLDGMGYLQYYSPGDYAAIRWLNSYVQGDPVIVEAFGPEGGDYSDYGRISAFTGLPTLVGWAGHEYQWRVNWLNDPYNAADFYRRGSDVNTIYTSKDPNVVLGLLAHYQAQYLYVGALEIVTYAGSDLHRFGAFMHVAYSGNGVTIYKVP